MVQSEKLRHKLIESTHQHPYENLLLIDLPGEIWRPFPVAPFDECYVVSNKGRIKREARIIRRKNVDCHLPERIVKQSLLWRYNSHLKQEFYSLIFRAIQNGFRKDYPTGRIIYYAFVEPFDIFDPNLVIRYKDGNGLNVQPENLYLFERKNLARWILDNDRRSRLVGVSDREKWPQEEVQRWIDLQKKSVCQYDLEGQLVATYNSRLEAAGATGINATQITAAIKERQQTAGNFLWIEGANNPPQIDVPELKLLNSPVKHQKVAQYNLDGNLLQVFPTIKEAAESINISSTTLNHRIRRPTSPKDGFIWKTVDDKQEPPVKIIVTPFVPVKTRRKNNPPVSGNFTYPYQNYSLDDMPGEIWKAIPNTGNTHFASNCGRIKAADRIIERNNAQLWQLERIIHQAVRKSKRTCLQSLTVHFTIDKKIFSYQVPNLIYTLYHGEIPPKHTIKYIDNDPMNCKAENLTLQSLSNKFKQYHEQGMLLNSRLYKPIAQYTLEGEHVKTYPSLKDAAEQTGMNKSKLSECANGKRKRNKGYLWKYI